jgi:hypothetical protein
MPNVSPADVRSLDIVRTGGQDPTGLARAKCSSNALAVIRATTKHETSSVSPLSAFELEALYRLRKVQWWDMATNTMYETRGMIGEEQWTSKFFIPTSGNSVYMLTLTF